MKRGNWWARKQSKTIEAHRRHKKRNQARRDLLEAQRGHCAICGFTLDDGPTTLDHVFPASFGGKDDWNMTVAHLACNQAKGNRMPTGCEIIWLHAANAGLG